MNSRKIVSIVLVIFCVASIFAGCANKNTEGKEEQKEDVSNTEFKMDFSKYITDEGRLKIKSSEYVTIGEYENIEVPKSKIAVSDDEIQVEINALLKNHATREISKEGKVESNSTLNIDYVGSVDGVAFEGSSTDGKGTQVTIGVTKYIDTFLEQLIGHSVGENFDIKVTFPNEYPQNTELAGKEAVFNVTINYLVGPEVLPEYTDEFMQDNKTTTGFATTSEHTANVKQKLENEKKSQYILQTLFTSSKVSEVPQQMIDYQADIFLLQGTNQAKQLGMKLEQLLQLMGGLTLDTFKEKMASDFKKGAEQIMILDAIIDLTANTISDKDLKDTFGENLENYKTNFGIGYLKMSLAHEQIVVNAQKTATVK